MLIKGHLFFVALVIGLFLSFPAWAGEVQWAPVELRFKASQTYSWRSFPLQAIFSNGEQTLTLDAYWISRYLLARYACYNIIYVITGEYDSKRNEAIWQPLDNWFKLGDWIKSINDKAYQVPLGAHPLTASSSEKMHGQPWLSYNQIQTKLFDEFNKVAYCVLDDYRKQPASPSPIYKTRLIRLPGTIRGKRNTWRSMVVDR